MLVFLNKLKYPLGTVLLALLTLLRFGKLFTRNVFNDFNAYYDVSQAIIKGVDPYNLANLSLKWVDPPIVFPGYVSFFAPFVIFDLDIAKYLYLILNILLGITVGIILFKHVLQLEKKDLKSLNKNSFFFVLALFAFLNSAPFLTCLKHGQTSILLAFSMLFIIATSKAGIFSYFLMSTAAVLKYSIMPFYGILLFCKRHFILCLGSFFLFLFWGIIPAFFGHNLGELYSKYISVLKEQIAGGFNSFPISGYNMIQLDCFKIPFLGLGLKLVFVGIFFVLLYKNIKRKVIGVNFMLFSMCVTMIIAYHRVYDMVLVIPLLIMVLITLIQAKKVPQAAIAAIFILFFLLPETIVFSISNLIGGLIGENSVVYLSSFNHWKTIFPILPLTVLGLSIFTVYLCCYLEEKFLFEFASADIVNILKIWNNVISQKRKND